MVIFYLQIQLPDSPRSPKTGSVYSSLNPSKPTHSRCSANIWWITDKFTVHSRQEQKLLSCLGPDPRWTIFRAHRNGQHSSFFQTGPLTHDFDTFIHLSKHSRMFLPEDKLLLFAEKPHFLPWYTLETPWYTLWNQWGSFLKICSGNTVTQYLIFYNWCWGGKRVKEHTLLSKGFGWFIRAKCSIM